MKLNSGSGSIEKSDEIYYFTSLLAGDFKIGNTVTSQTQAGTTAKIRNPSYETSAGSFSKPFTKFIVSDEHAGVSTDIRSIVEVSMNAALAAQGRYEALKSSQRTRDGLVTWFDVFVSETNRPIPLYFNVFQAHWQSNEHFTCSTDNGIWYDGNLYATSGFSSDANRTNRYSTVCKDEYGGKNYSYFTVYHGHDAIRVYQ